MFVARKFILYITYPKNFILHISPYFLNKLSEETTKVLLQFGWLGRKFSS